MNQVMEEENQSSEESDLLKEDFDKSIIDTEMNKREINLDRKDFIIRKKNKGTANNKKITGSKSVVQKRTLKQIYKLLKRDVKSNDSEQVA